jgi:hypothetical protein
MEKENVMMKFGLIFLLFLYSLNARACIIPAYSGFADLSILVAIVSCGFAVLFRKLAKKNVWRPVFVITLLSITLIPFYFFTPESFYENCGNEQVKFLYLLMLIIIFIPLYELFSLLKVKFGK